MKLFGNLFKHKSDVISPSTVRVGMVLRVHPGLRSHSNKPYDVTVIESSNDYFKTELVHPEQCDYSHIRTFRYDAKEWTDYHCNRFEIMNAKLDKRG